MSFALAHPALSFKTAGSVIPAILPEDPQVIEAPKVRKKEDRRQLIDEARGAHYQDQPYGTSLAVGGALGLAAWPLLSALKHGPAGSWENFKNDPAHNLKMMALLTGAGAATGPMLEAAQRGVARFLGPRFDRRKWHRDQDPHRMNAVLRLAPLLAAIPAKGMLNQYLTGDGQNKVSAFKQTPEQIRAAVRAAEEQVRVPSKVQIESGNYQKGHVRLHGLAITFETASGQQRKGVSEDGKEWSVTLSAPYGYIKGTRSAEPGDQMDVFVGPAPEIELVFVVDQNKYGTSDFDEHKCVMGVRNSKEAVELYHANYSAGWKGYRSVTPLTIPQFKRWLEHGDMTKPLAEQKLADFHKEASVGSRAGQWLNKGVDLAGAGYIGAMHGGHLGAKWPWLISPQHTWQATKRLWRDPAASMLSSDFGINAGGLAGLLMLNNSAAGSTVGALSAMVHKVKSWLPVKSSAVADHTHTYRFKEAANEKEKKRAPYKLVQGALPVIGGGALGLGMTVGGAVLPLIGAPLTHALIHSFDQPSKQKSAGLCKAALSWRDIQSQLPGLHKWEAGLGALAGAAGGYGYHQLRRSYGQKYRNEDHADKDAIKRTLLGALMGGFGGNLLSDRVRRYATNIPNPVGYDVHDQISDLRKAGWQGFVDGFIKDKPVYLTTGKGLDHSVVRHLRRETLRRGMGVHTDNPTTDYLKVTGEYKGAPVLGMADRFFGPNHQLLDNKEALDVWEQVRPHSMERVLSKDPGKFHSVTGPFMANFSARRFGDNVQLYDRWDFDLHDDEQKKLKSNLSMWWDQLLKKPSLAMLGPTTSLGKPEAKNTATLAMRWLMDKTLASKMPFFFQTFQQDAAPTPAETSENGYVADTVKAPLPYRVPLFGDDRR